MNFVNKKIVSDLPIGSRDMFSGMRTGVPDEAQSQERDSVSMKLAHVIEKQTQ